MSVRDLRDRLTAFVITVGDRANFEECSRRLRAQTVKFRLDSIRNTAPMSEAFNEMHRRCQTPTFVQVDEDMLLVPDAVERLYAALEESSPKTAIVTAPLWDVQIARPIYGVKIYRSEIVTRFPHRDVISCEVDHNRQLTEAGYELRELPLVWSQNECFGLHGKYYTPETAFLRWRRLFLKRRRTGRPLWPAPWPARLLDRYCKTRDETDLYSFLGAVSALCGAQPDDREHDFREKCADFERLREALEVDSGGRETVREVGEAARGWKARLVRWLRSRA